MPEGKKPVGTLYAVIERANDKDLWVLLGPTCQNRDGSFGGVMHSEPIAWSKPGPRRIYFSAITIRFVLQFHKEERQEAPTHNDY